MDTSHTDPDRAEVPRLTVGLYEPDWRAVQQIAVARGTTPSAVVDDALGTLDDCAEIPTPSDDPRISCKLRLSKSTRTAMRTAAWEHSVRHADIVRAALQGMEAQGDTSGL